MIPTHRPRAGHNGKRILALLLACLLAAGIAVRGHAVTDTVDTTQTDLQNRKDEAQRNIDEANRQIAEAQARGETAQQLKAQYQQQQNAIRETMNAINAQIEEMNGQIESLAEQSRQKELEVEQKQAEFNARWAGFKERMVAMQMLNDGGSIALLSNVTNLYELLTFPQTLADIANRDQQVLQQLEQERAELNALKEAYDAAAAQLEEAKGKLQGQLEELDSLVQQLSASIRAQNAAIGAAEADEQAQQESLSDYEREFAAASAALDAYIAAQDKKYEDETPVVAGPITFGKPIAYYSYISNGYGSYGSNNWRASAHGGTDLVASEGTAIYAAADGIVTISHTWGGGLQGNESFGNFVKINHGTASDGNEYATIYAHMMQTPSVSEGSYVTRGQVIGYVGHTGRVSGNPGNHLHLELRINGVRADPTSMIPL